MTVTGTNDVPVVATTDVTGAVTELVTASGNLTDAGTITFTDVDLTDVHTLSAVSASTGALGALTVVKTTDTTGTGTGGVLTWNYSVAASAVEYLAEGQTKLETFTFNVLDGQGGLVQRTVSVTVTGTNDVPLLSVSNPSTTFESNLDSIGTAVSSSTTVRSDIDLRDIAEGFPVFVTSDWIATANEESIFTRVGNFGSLTLNKTTGALTYLLDQANVETQSLAKNQVDYDRFNLIVSDGKAQTLTQASFKVVGADDPVNIAVASGATANLDLVSGGSSLVSLKIPASLSAYESSITDTDSTISYTAYFVDSAGVSYTNFSLTSNGNTLSGLVTLPVGVVPLSMQLAVASTNGTIQNLTTAVDLTSQSYVGATRLSTITGSTNRSDYILGTDLLMGYSDRPGFVPPTFLGLGGDDLLLNINGGQLFAGGTGNDTAVFDKANFLYGSDPALSFYKISMMSMGSAWNVLGSGVVPTNFANAVNPTRASSSQYGYLTITAGDDSVAYVQAENLIFADYTAGAVNANVSYHVEPVISGLNTDFVLFLSDGADRVSAGSLTDNINAGAGGDTVYGGGNGNVSTYAADVIEGGSGDDLLAAGQAQFDSAILNGGAGDDVLVAVAGTVTATGGTGRDVFAVYDNLHDVHMFIQDFNATVDRIDLSAFSQLHSGAAPTSALADLVANAIQTQQHPGDALVINLSNFLSPLTTAEVEAGVTKTADITLSSISGGQLSLQSFVFDNTAWSPADWRHNLDPLINS